MDWNVIDSIYFNPTQDVVQHTWDHGADIGIMQEAADELQTYLSQMAGRAFTITSIFPSGPAVVLSVNPAMLPGRGNQAFRIQTSASGVNVIGYNALAVRYGAYMLLRKLGVRWYFRHPDWWHVPAGLLNLGDIDEIHEPSFIWREFNVPPTNDWGGYMQWKRRNMLGGPIAFRVGHSYYQIMGPEEFETYPDAYTVMRTALIADVDASVTDIPVESTSRYPDVTGDTPDPFIKIGSEYIRYESRAGNIFSGCTRGYLDTVAAPHSVGDTVTQIPPPGSFNTWQLYPNHPEVIARANAFALAQTQTQEYHQLHIDHWSELENRRAVISISPNDGWGWADLQPDVQPNPEAASQLLTDLVVGLVDEVAGHLNANGHSDYFAGLYCYSWYSAVATAMLANPNVYIGIATSYVHGTPLSEYERIAGYRARGTVVGIRDYMDIPGRTNTPQLDYYYRRWQSIKDFANAGANVWGGESGDCWGSGGLLYYIAAQLVWDSHLSVSTLMDEFFLDCFGPAASHMRQYYNIWLNGPSVSDGTLGASFDALSKAEQAAAGDTAIIKRIRHLEYYMRYIWIIRNRDTWTLDEAHAAWLYVTKLRDLYVVWYRTMYDDEIHDRMRAIYMSLNPQNPGELDSDYYLRIDSMTYDWQDANTDFIPPTDAEASAWLSEGLAAFTGGVYAPYIDPETIQLAGHVGTGTVYPPPEAHHESVLVLANEGDTIVSSLLRNPYDPNTYNLYGPAGQLLETFDTPAVRGWEPHDFIASAGSGVYRITGNGIDITSHHAGIEGTESRSVLIGNINLWFYVPEGTPAIIVEFSSGTRVRTLYAPDGSVAGATTGTVTASESIGMTNPSPGMWRLNFIQGPSAELSDIKLYGVPDLLWHNPSQVLIQSTEVVTTAKMTLTATVGGTISPQPGVYYVTVGESILLIAYPSSGYTFRGWARNGVQFSSNTAENYLVDSDEDITITAIFEQLPTPTHTLTVAVSGNGTTVPEAGSHPVLEGAAIQLMASPDEGNYFVRWEENGIPLSSELQVTIALFGDRSVQAIFAEVPQPTIYQLTINATQGGTTNPAPGVHSYAEGSEVTISANASAGWNFAHWEVGSNTYTQPQLNILMNASVEIRAVFEAIVIPPDQHAITISVVGQGETYPAGSYTVAQGTSQTIEATPAAGWRFDHWEGDAAGTNSTLTIPAVDADLSIIAVFVELPPPPPAGGSAAGLAIAAAVVVSLLASRR